MSGDREDETGFANRWSRLKREAKAEEPESGGDAEAGGEPEPPVEDDRPDEEVLEELGLPDPDTLEPCDNFSAFMARARKMLTAVLPDAVEPSRTYRGAGISWIGQNAGAVRPVPFARTPGGRGDRPGVFRWRRADPPGNSFLPG